MFAQAYTKQPPTMGRIDHENNEIMESKASTDIEVVKELFT